MGIVNCHLLNNFVILINKYLHILNSYQTISSTYRAELKEKGSSFIGIIFPVTDESNFKAKLVEIKKEYPDAAHHCWAFIAGQQMELQKSSDDREPSNSAGKPILRQLLSSKITNCAIVVVRYFGGKLLGVPGLIQAYGNAAALVIKSAEIVTIEVYKRFTVTGNFPDDNDLHKWYKQFACKLISHHYNQNVFISIFEVKASNAERLRTLILDKRCFELEESIN